MLNILKNEFCFLRKNQSKWASCETLNITTNPAEEVLSLNTYNIRKSIFFVLLITSIFSVVEIANNVLLGRWLSRHDFGSFKLFSTTIALVGGILLFGQNAVIIRALCRPDINQYNWRSHITKVGKWGLCGAFPVSLLIAWLYDFWFELPVLIIGITGFLYIVPN